jgi:hypothetical protein
MRQRVEAAEIRFAEESLRVGAFANAFRVTPDSGEECFLDFCVFSPSESTAVIVARIRVRHEFMPVIRERLEHWMQDINATTILPIMGGDGDN